MSLQGAHRRHRRAGHGRGGRDHDGAGAGRRGAAQVRRRLGGRGASATGRLRRVTRVDPVATDGRAPVRQRSAVTTPRILLIGMMGAGKTTTGAARWPRRLGWRYLDRDAEVDAAHRPHRARDLRERRRGRLPGRGGRGAGRRRATGDRPVVIAVAGGAVLDAGQPAPDPRARHWSSGCAPSRSVLAARVGDGAGRPLLERRPGARPWPASSEERAPHLRRGGRRSSSTSTTSHPTRWPTGCVDAAWRSARRDAGDTVELSPVHASPSTSATAPTRCWSAPAPATGCSRCSRVGAHRAAIVTQEAIGVGGRRRRSSTASFSSSTTARRPRPSRRSRSCAAALRPLGPHPGRRRRGRRRRRGHRLGRLRRRRLPPGHRRRARAHHPARPGRRRHRRQDRRQPARGQEPGRRLLAARRRALRHRDPRAPCRPGSTAAAWARWPSTPSSASTACGDLPLDDAVAACVACKAAVVGRRRARGAAGRAILNYGHTLGPRPRDAGGTTTCATARRWRIGLVFAARAGPAAGPHRPRAGWPSTTGWWPATTCLPVCRPAPTPTSWSTSWAGTRRPPHGLTFVLDGPTGLAVVAGVPAT